MPVLKRQIERGGDDPAKSAWIDAYLKTLGRSGKPWPYPVRRRSKVADRGLYSTENSPRSATVSQETINAANATRMSHLGKEGER
jgi:hypothetical protein